jgi:cell division protein FtsA
LAEVVEPRYDELFKLVQAELRRSGFEHLVASGIVLTGGGAKMEGLIELAEEIFHMPVSLGAPRNVAGLKDIVRNPVFATGVGLLQYGLDQEKEKPSKQSDRKSGTLAKLKGWFSENF